MGSTTRQLVANITSTNTWTQLTEGAGGSAYAVPSGGRATLRFISALNNDSDEALIEFAISTDSTISDAERVLQPVTLDADGGFAESDDIQVIQQNEALWARVTGTTPNATIRASILEVTA